MILLFDFRQYGIEIGGQCCLDLQPSARCQRQQSRQYEYKDFQSDYNVLCALQMLIFGRFGL